MWDTYGVHVWGLTFPSFLSQLFIIQKKAIRISFSEPKSHSEPLFKFLNLLKLNDVIELQVTLFYLSVVTQTITSLFQ